MGLEGVAEELDVGQSKRPSSLGSSSVSRNPRIEQVGVEREHGTWGEQSRSSIPSLCEPGASDLGVSTAWAFPLDRASAAQSSACVSARLTGPGQVWFSCYGSGPAEFVEYTFQIDPSLETRLVGTTVNDNYRDGLTQAPIATRPV